MTKYVQMTSNGLLHIIKEAGKTVCGRNYRQYDYIPHDTVDEYHTLCYKCRNKRRPGPRTIKEAFRPGCYETQHQAEKRSNG